MDSTEQRVLVGGKRTLSKAFARKHNDTYAVACAVNDKLRGHLTCRTNAVGLKVARQHTARNIHRQHNVDTLGCGVAALLGALRTRQCNNHQRNSTHTQCE